jgi:hypothetical protein
MTDSDPYPTAARTACAARAALTLQLRCTYAAACSVTTARAADALQGCSVSAARAVVTLQLRCRYAAACSVSTARAAYTLRACSVNAVRAVDALQRLRLLHLTLQLRCKDLGT